MVEIIFVLLFRCLITKILLDFNTDMEIDFKPAHQIQSQRRSNPSKAGDSSVKDNQINTENPDEEEGDDDVHNIERAIGDGMEEHLQKINLNEEMNQEDDIEENVDSDNEDMIKEVQNDIEH